MSDTPADSDQHNGKGRAQKSSWLLTVLIAALLVTGYFVPVRFESAMFTALYVFFVAALSLWYLAQQILAVVGRIVIQEKRIVSDINTSRLPVYAIVAGVVARFVFYFFVDTAAHPMPEITAGLEDLTSWPLWAFGFLSLLEWISLILVGCAVRIDITLVEEIMYKIAILVSELVEFK